ncbi:MAG: sugar phosphate isomerase/epimerase family protein [Clostridia bacterium]|jgi:L-ribulose-5-phosphate 3-epimerase
MKKAINAWSVPRHVTFGEMFRDISRAGFDGIELNVDAEGYSNHSLAMSTGKDTFSVINDLIEEYKLPVASISTSLFGGKLGSNDKRVRESGKDIIRKQLECAAALGADGILIVPGGMTEDISLLQAYENSLLAIDELKPEIESAKIHVGVENVWNGFFLSPFDMKNFIDDLNCRYIGAYFDVGNVMAFSNAEYWIEILDNRIRKIHVKDFKRNNGINRGGCFVNLLEGDVDWHKVMAALNKAGYDDYLTAELEIMGGPPDYLYKITSEALDIIIMNGRE